MTREVSLRTGAGRGSAPATLPDQYAGGDVDDELVDLLCDDPAWLDEAFREIVAASWAEPPRGGAARLGARPRRNGVPGPQAERGGAVVRAQWIVEPAGRQRSPPGRSAAV